MKHCFIAAVLSLAAGCGDYHTLEPRVAAPAQRDCRVGVGPLVDAVGIDHSFALRDRLRAEGPCKHVLLVRGERDDKMDLIVSGDVATYLEKNKPNETTTSVVGSGILAVGIIAAALGGTFLIVHEVADGSDNEFIQQAATYTLIGGGAAMATGATMMVVNGTAIREVEMDGWVEASGKITGPEGTVLDEWHFRDEFQVSTHHPSSRPESIYSHEAHGPLYELAMDKVFDGITRRVSDTLVQHGAQVARLQSGLDGRAKGNESDW